MQEARLEGNVFGNEGRGILERLEQLKRDTVTMKATLCRHSEAIDALEPVAREGRWRFLRVFMRNRMRMLNREAIEFGNISVHGANFVADARLFAPPTSKLSCGPFDLGIGGEEAAFAAIYGFPPVQALRWVSEFHTLSLFSIFSRFL